MNTETETPSEYGSDKPVGWVVHDPKSLEAARGKIKTLYEALQSQAREIAQLRHEVEKYSSRYDLATLSIKNQQEKLAQMTAENAALESTIEGLELDIEGYQHQIIEQSSTIQRLKPALAASIGRELDLETENQRLRDREWISVKDRLPDGDEYVLTISDDAYYYVDCLSSNIPDRFFQDSHSPKGPDVVAYWMPLPPPPDTGAEYGSDKPVGDVGDAAKELQNVVIPRLVLNEDTVSAKHVRQAISALEAQAREIAKLKRRVPVAKHNALQEEATGLLAAVKTYQTKIAEQQKRIADSDEVKG